MNKLAVEPIQKVGSNSYRGTAAALVAAGVLRQDQFPGEPGRPPKVVFYRGGHQVMPVRRIDLQPDSEQWMKVRDLGDGVYMVDIGIPRDERLRRLRKSFEEGREFHERIAREREEARAQRLAEAEAQARARHAGMTEEAFLKAMEGRLMIAAVNVLAHVEGHESEYTQYPFRFESAAFKGLLGLINAAVTAVREYAVVREGANGLAAARADARFQSFLASQCLREDGHA